MAVEQTSLFDVEGMTCGSCVRHVSKALGELEGVHEVQVRLRDGQVLVRYDSQKIAPSALVEALGDAGYPSRATKAPMSSAQRTTG